MQKLPGKCPACGGALRITALRCCECGLELKNDFPPSRFDRLDNEQYAFLLSFLRARGNLKNLQNEMQISYPTAKKRLEELLVMLDLTDDPRGRSDMCEVIDVKKWATNAVSTKASEIVKCKLKECGGRAIVHTARGLPCEIWAVQNGDAFASDKLPQFNYRYEVFDVIVDLLVANGGCAKKGNGRNHKLGEPECDETTVVGAIAKNYAGKSDGDSVYDPVFVLAAVLEWAEIAQNERGQLTLFPSYISRL